MTTEKLALCDVSGPLKQLTDCLGGNQGHEWLAALKLFLRRENPWQRDGSERFPTELVVPRTINARDVSLAIGALRGGHIQFAGGALMLIASDRNLYECDYGLVVTTPMHMDLGEEPALEFVLERATALGLAPCPAAVVAHVLMHEKQFASKHGKLVVPVQSGTRPQHSVCVLTMYSSPDGGSLRMDTLSLGKKIAKTTPLLFVRCIQ